MDSSIEWIFHLYTETYVRYKLSDTIMCGRGVNLNICLECCYYSCKYLESIFGNIRNAERETSYKLMQTDKYDWFILVFVCSMRHQYLVCLEDERMFFFCSLNDKIIIICTNGNSIYFFLLYVCNYWLPGFN